MASIEMTLGSRASVAHVYIRETGNLINNLLNSAHLHLCVVSHDVSLVCYPIEYTAQHHNQQCVHIICLYACMHVYVHIHTLYR